MAEENKMEEFSTEEAVKEAVKEAELEAEAAQESEGSEEPAADVSEEPAGDNEPESEDNSEKTDKEGKKPFKKKEKKKDKRDEKIEELNDKVMRQMAEFENFRKRTEKEKTAMFDLGAKGVVEKLLPVIDNFERGFDSIKEAERDTDSFVSGMDMVYKQLMKVLEDMGVEVIDTKDKEFDPNLHDAVMQTPTDDIEENHIINELQKGYKLGDKVLRPALVNVAAKP